MSREDEKWDPIVVSAIFSVKILIKKRYNNLSMVKNQKWCCSKFFFVNLNSFLFIVALINIFVAKFSLHTFWTFTLIWAWYIFTNGTITTIVQPKFTFVNIHTLFIFIHFESSFTFAFTATRCLSTIRVCTTHWSFLTTTGKTGPILKKLHRIK